MEKDDDADYSKPVRFNLEDVFRSLSIWGVEEMTLDGNKLLKDIDRLKFYPDPPNSSFVTTTADSYLNNNEKDQNEVAMNSFEKRSADKENNEIIPNEESVADDARYYGIDYEVTLKPMQIKTYVITLQPQIVIPTA